MREISANRFRKRKLLDRFRSVFNNLGLTEKISGFIDKAWGVEKGEMIDFHYPFFYSSPSMNAVIEAYGGRCKVVNRAFEIKLGYTNSVVSNKTLQELNICTDRSAMSIEAIRMLAEGGSDEKKVDLIDDSGGVHRCSVKAEHVRYQNEKHILLSLSDMSGGNDDKNALLLLEKAMDTTATGITVCDLEGRILFINNADAEMHGYTPDELIGKDVSVFSTNKSGNRLTPEQLDSISNWTRERLNIRKDGSVIPVRLTSDAVRNEHDEVIGLVTICEDISQRKKTEHELSLACGELGLPIDEGEVNLEILSSLLKEEVSKRIHLESGMVRLSHAIEQSPSIIMIADQHWIVEYVNHKFCEITGFRAEDVIGTSLFDYCNSPHPGFREEVVNIVKSGVDWKGEFYNLNKENNRYWESAHLSIIENNGNPVSILKVAEDITYRKKIEDELEQQTFYDKLTKLPNRALFYDRLKHVSERGKREISYLYGILFLDLDRFQIINDSLGHAIGDELLSAVAERLMQCIRPGDTVGRLGGDEFAVLAENISDISDISHIAERIHSVLGEPFDIRGNEIFISASIGIAMDLGYDNYEDLLRDADTAMYMAKVNGRGWYHIYDDQLHAHAVCMLEREANLRRAVQRKEFYPVFQPIVCLATKRVIGAEALIRWGNSSNDHTKPSEFIELAEETGLISAIGEFMLREAAGQGKRLKDMGIRNISISVNCSVRQLYQEEFSSIVERILTEYDINPSMLELEITESVTMDKRATDVLCELDSMGIRISIDDFGTGYSSFSRLKSLPISRLKIDRFFIKDINADSDARDIVSAIIAMANALSLFIIAEGIEGEEQMMVLKELGCDAAQGYLFAMPMSGDDFLEYIQNTNMKMAGG